MFRTLILPAMAGLAVASGVQAQTTPPHSPSPSPSPGDAASMPLSFYPARAQRMEVDGDTVLDCNVTDEGRLDDCRLVSETPAGYGFGEAALKVSRIWRMKPASDAAGNPVPGGRITIPLKWRVPK